MAIKNPTNVYVLKKLGEDPILAVNASEAGSKRAARRAFSKGLTFKHTTPEFINVHEGKCALAIARITILTLGE